jgi:hypothetical protein
MGAKGMGSTSDANTVAGESEELVDYLDADEVIEAYEALSGNDKMKLVAIERRLLGGTGRVASELLWEALYRANCGTRRCPRDVPVMAFMVETMRSIASHDRDRRRRQASLDDNADVGERVKVLPGALASDIANPEEVLLHNEAPEVDVVATIHGHFAGDEEIQMVLIGWADRLRGKALRDLVGVDQVRLDYLIKKIRRKMLKLYPTGCIQ